MPVGPVEPAPPVDPVGPPEPVGPVGPLIEAPVGPVGPLPVGPVGPLPVGPVGPPEPVGPVGPGKSSASAVMNTCAEPERLMAALLLVECSTERVSVCAPALYTPLPTSLFAPSSIA